MAQDGLRQMSQFLDDNLEAVVGASLEKDALVRAYLVYCREKAVVPGGGSRPGDQLGKALASWGGGFHKGRHANSYRGVRLKGQHDEGREGKRMQQERPEALPDLLKKEFERGKIEGARLLEEVRAPMLHDAVPIVVPRPTARCCFCLPHWRFLSATGFARANGCVCARAECEDQTAGAGARTSGTVCQRGWGGVRNAGGFAQGAA